MKGPFLTPLPSLRKTHFQSCAVWLVWNRLTAVSFFSLLHLPPFFTSLQERLLIRPKILLIYYCLRHSFFLLPAQIP